jgi:hypothetical protein
MPGRVVLTHHDDAGPLVLGSRDSLSSQPKHAFTLFGLLLARQLNPGWSVTKLTERLE